MENPIIKDVPKVEEVEIEETETLDLSDIDPKIRALMEHVGESDPTTIEAESYDDNHFTWGKEEYLILTDSEADDAWDKELDNYLEELIYPELPEHLQNYFDDDKWKSDAKMDGRGHALNRYDGNEHEVKIDGEWYYIFRQN